jgi:predicted NBD/HSP70 family sugar kinase
MNSAEPTRAGDARWRTASAVLAEVRRQPGVTRAGAARRLGLSTGSAAEVAARLRDLRLLTEVPAMPRGRGRPTAVLRPHPVGPLLLVIEVRHDDWRGELVTLDGEPSPFGAGRHTPDRPEPVLAELAELIRTARRRLGHRLRAVSLAVAATVAHGRVVDTSSLGWGSVDLTALTGGPTDTASDLPLLVGNDATLAGVAEARSGAARDSHTALHLLLEAGIGGSLTLAGRPVTGASGAAGEYGHLPFAERTLRCPCGASGCWELAVSATALAWRLGEPPPPRPRDYTLEVLDRVPRVPAAGTAVAASAAALAAGIAGLVNAHDPDVVTLGGLAGPLRAAAPAAFTSAYQDGLMAFRRAQPPPVLDAAHGEHAARRGAAAVGLDAITTEPALSAWARLHTTEQGSAAAGEQGHP